VRIKTEPTVEIRAGDQVRASPPGTSEVSPVERKNAEADLFMAQVDAFLGENPSEDRMRLAEEIREVALKEGIPFAAAVDRQIEAFQKAARHRRRRRHKRRQGGDPFWEAIYTLSLIVAMLVFVLALATGWNGFWLFLVFVFAVAVVSLVRAFSKDS